MNQASGAIPLLAGRRPYQGAQGLCSGCWDIWKHSWVLAGCGPAAMLVLRCLAFPGPKSGWLRRLLSFSPFFAPYEQHDTQPCSCRGAGSLPKSITGNLAEEKQSSSVTAQKHMVLIKPARTNCGYFRSTKTGKLLSDRHTKPLPKGTFATSLDTGKQLTPSSRSQRPSFRIETQDPKTLQASREALRL